MRFCQWMKYGLAVILFGALVIVALKVTVSLVRLPPDEIHLKSSTSGDMMVLTKACIDYGRATGEPFPSSLDMLVPQFLAEQDYLRLVHMSPGRGDHGSGGLAFVTGLDAALPLRSVLAFSPSSALWEGTGAAILRTDMSGGWCNAGRFSDLVATPESFFGTTNRSVLRRLRTEARIVMPVRFGPAWVPFATTKGSGVIQEGSGEGSGVIH